MPLIKRDNEIRTQNTRKASRAYPFLLEQLNAETPVERRWAARDLAQHPESVFALCDRLLVEKDTIVKEMIFTSLITINTPECIDGLFTLLRNEDADLRNGAADALKVLSDTVAARLHDLLADDDVDVRIFAVNILASLRNTNVIDWLLQVIRHESDVNVCATVIDVIRELDATEAIPDLSLLKEKFHSEPFILFAVDMALGQLHAAQQSARGVA